MRAATRRLVLTAIAALSLAACGQANGAKPASGGAIGDEMVQGNPNAKVTVVEYASASCPHCAQWHEEVYPSFKKKYVDTGQVKFVFREFITPPPEVAAAGALLARCAGKDKYFAVLDAVFRSQKEWGPTGDVRSSFLRIAQSFGMNEQQFTACVSNEKEQRALFDRVQRFATKEGISSTPTFVINGQKISGAASLAQLDAAIAAAKK
jgi:protein-disulfide isomerase